MEMSRHLSPEYFIYYPFIDHFLIAPVDYPLTHRTWGWRRKAADLETQALDAAQGRDDAEKKAWWKRWRWKGAKGCLVQKDAFLKSGWWRVDTTWSIDLSFGFLDPFAIAMYTISHPSYEVCVQCRHAALRMLGFKYETMPEIKCDCNPKREQQRWRELYNYPLQMTKVCPEWNFLQLRRRCVRPCEAWRGPRIDRRRRRGWPSRTGFGWNNLDWLQYDWWSEYCIQNFCISCAYCTQIEHFFYCFGSL